MRAGFPSPADDYLEGEVDLRREISGGRRSVRLVDVPDPEGRVPRLVLAVDAALRPADGDTVLAHVHGDAVVARLRVGATGASLLLPGGVVADAAEARAAGVVTWSMRGFRDGPARRDADGYGFLTPVPHASFLFAVDGSSMRGAGIRDGDVLVVDRSLRAAPGDVVVAAIAGGRTVKRLLDDRGGAVLAFEEGPGDRRRLPLNPEDSLFGVVAWCLHRLRAPAAPPPRRGRA